MSTSTALEHGYPLTNEYGTVPYRQVRPSRFVGAPPPTIPSYSQLQQQPQNSPVVERYATSSAPENAPDAQHRKAASQPATSRITPSVLTCRMVRQHILECEICEPMYLPPRWQRWFWPVLAGVLCISCLVLSHRLSYIQGLLKTCTTTSASGAPGLYKHIQHAPRTTTTHNVHPVATVAPRS